MQYAICKARSLKRAHTICKLRSLKCSCCALSAHVIRNVRSLQLNSNCSTLSATPALSLPLLFAGIFCICLRAALSMPLSWEPHTHTHTAAISSTCNSIRDAACCCCCYICICGMLPTPFRCCLEPQTITCCRYRCRCSNIAAAATPAALRCCCCCSAAI